MDLLSSLVFSSSSSLALRCFHCSAFTLCRSSFSAFTPLTAFGAVVAAAAAAFLACFLFLSRPIDRSRRLMYGDQEDKEKEESGKQAGNN